MGGDAVGLMSLDDLLRLGAEARRAVEEQQEVTLSVMRCLAAVILAQGGQVTIDTRILVETDFDSMELLTWDEPDGRNRIVACRRKGT